MTDDDVMMIDKTLLGYAVSVEKDMTRTTVYWHTLDHTTNQYDTAAAADVAAFTVYELYAGKMTDDEAPFMYDTVELSELYNVTDYPASREYIEQRIIHRWRKPS